MSETRPGDHPDAIRQRLAAILHDRYEVLRSVGAGGMSTIYLARHRLHKGWFAIKVLHPHLAREPEIRACFYREAMYAARLAGHPNIATVFDVGEKEGLHYLVMPYVRGEDLDSVLARYGRFPVAEVLRFAAQITNTLRYAEEQGVLHADLTPGNLRLNLFGSWIILDFGLARPTSPHGTELFKTLRVGTPSYMSPEGIRGERIDIRSDLYSLGVILFELLTGKRPFEGATCSEVERSHLQQAPAIPEELIQEHPKIASLVQWLLRKSREERPPNAMALQADLQKIVVPPIESFIEPVVAQVDLRRHARKRLLSSVEPEVMAPAGGADPFSNAGRGSAHS